MVGVEFGFENVGDELLRMGTMFGCPSDHARRGPVEIGLMGFREVFVKGSKLSFLITSGMGGDALVFE
jgi:hypothetical protein